MEEQRNIESINTLLNNKENECLELKSNNTDPKVIGKLCSALSNSARIIGKNYAYILWGVNDDCQIIGTDFNPNDKNIIKFKLSDNLDKMQLLMKNLQTHIWEQEIAKSFLTANEVLDYLAHKVYFKLTGQTLAQDISEILQYLEKDNIIKKDVTITGAGPQIELFNNRLEVTNPGKSLNSVDRIIDLPPISRNERLAALMRRMRLCEEQGSGIDKVIYSVEEAQLPAPKFSVYDNSTQVTLYAYRTFADLTTEERIRACYQHAVIRYISGFKLKNSSLCVRFGIKKGNESQVSKVIKNTLLKGLIKIADTEIPRSGYYPSLA